MRDRFDELVSDICRNASGVPGDVREVVAAQVDRMAPLASDCDRTRLVTRAVSRLAGLDALDEHLRDPDVDEVMVNRGSEVWVDRRGGLHMVAELPAGTADVILERTLAATGQRLDRTTPLVDTRLPDGARLCAVVDPIAVDGTTIAIRRHRSRQFPISSFAHPELVELLSTIVRSRLNVLVIGPTSSGKTSLLGALVELADPHDRLVVIEDTTELTLRDRHVVRLEARRATADGIRAIDQSELVRTALRLRPDRLIVGEFRGSEVLAVVEALNTGHDGSLSTCHANGSVDALRRVETLVMQAAPSWPLPAIRRQITRSIDVVVQVERRPAGERHIVEVAEVRESDDEPDVDPLYTDDRCVAPPSRNRR